MLSRYLGSGPVWDSPIWRSYTITKRVMSSTCADSKLLTVENMNSGMVKSQYIMRGPIQLRTLELQNEIEKGSKKPFKSVIKATIGDAQAMGQKPITFIRQVIAGCTYPPLLEKSGFPEDVKKRVCEILEDCNGNTVGAYSPSRGLTYIRKHVAEYIKKRDGHSCRIENVVLTNGAALPLKQILQLFKNDIDGKPTGVMVPVPSSPVFTAFTAEHHLTHVNYYLDEKKNWGLDIEELQRAYEEATKKGVNIRVLVVLNPGNPTASVLTETNIEHLAKFAKKNSLFIIADEVYQQNIFEPCTPFCSLKKVLMTMGSPFSEMELVSVMSSSKGYMGECGLRGGWMEVFNLDAGVLEHVHKCNSTLNAAPVLGQVGMDCVAKPPQPGEPSYDLWKKETGDMLDCYKERAKFIYNSYKEIEGIHCNVIKGALYSYPRIDMPPKAFDAAKKSKQSPDYLYARQLLEETGVAVLPGTEFGQRPFTHHIRTTLPPMDKLKDMMERIKTFHPKFVKEYS